MKTQYEEIVRKYNEVDIEFPLYAYYSDEDNDCFVKIDSKYFYKITLSVYGQTATFSKCKFSGTISEFIWIRRKGHPSTWINALKLARKIIRGFK